MDRQRGLEENTTEVGEITATFSPSEIFHYTFFIQLYFSSDEDFLPDPNPIYIYIYKISLYIDFAVVQNGIFTVQKFNQYSLKKLDW